MIKVNVSRAPKARIAKSYQEDVSRIHNYIHNKTGEGNDFLGWVNYPQELMDYEFKKIKTIANKVIKDCERDNYMSSEEALKYGLIDEII